MTTATRKARRLGRLRQIAKHVQVEKDLRAELETIRARRRIDATAPLFARTE